MSGPRKASSPGASDAPGARREDQLGRQVGAKANLTPGPIQAVYDGRRCIGFLLPRGKQDAPDDLDVNGIDLARAEEVIGFGGETVREIIRDTYRCRSRAEEDHFIARWIAS